MEKKALHRISYGLYVTGMRNGDSFGGCMVDAFIQTTDTPPTAILCSIQRTYSNELIKLHREFTISVLPRDVDPKIIANFGFQSARTVDKWNNVEYDLHSGLPALACACSGMHLKVTDLRELSTHTMFFCDIEDAWLGSTDVEPLLYSEYQRSMKPATMAAFQALKEQYQST